MKINWFNRDFVLSIALGFVVIWFGINELLNPGNWIGFVPAFIGKGILATNLVLVHGVVLTITGLMIVFNFYRKYAAIVIALMLLEIVITIIFKFGFSPIAIRDIGLFGAALSLAISSSLPQSNNL